MGLPFKALAASLSHCVELDFGGRPRRRTVIRGSDRSGIIQKAPIGESTSLAPSIFPCRAHIRTVDSPTPSRIATCFAVSSFASFLGIG